jgi:hypothetical protein
MAKKRAVAVATAVASTLVTNGQDLVYSNPGGPPDSTGTWIGASASKTSHLPQTQIFTTHSLTHSLARSLARTRTGLSSPAWVSFELPNTSLRAWLSGSDGLVLEKLRYDSWECTDVAGVSRAQMTHVEIFVNGTTKTDSQCAMYQMVDSMTMNSVFHPCDEKPSAQDAQWKYTNVRAPNATIIEAAKTQVCVGSVDVKIDTSGGANGIATVPPLAGTKETMGDLGPVATLAEANKASGNDYPEVSESSLPECDSGVWMTTLRNPSGDLAEGFSINVPGQAAELIALQSGDEVEALMDFALATPLGAGYERVGAPNEYIYRGTGVLAIIQPAWNDTRWTFESVSTLLDASDPYQNLITDLNDTGFKDASAVNRLYFLPPQGELEDDKEGSVFAQALDMNGKNQVPPLTNVSTTANFHMLAPNAQGFVIYDLDVENAGSVGGYTMSHIHCGNSTSNGEVCVELVPSEKYWPSPIVTEGGLPELTPPVNVTTGFFGAFNADQFVGPLAGTKMDEFIKKVRASSENFYVNVHSAEYPAGVVRAQIQASADGPMPTPMPMPMPTPPKPPAGGARSAACAVAVAAAAGLAALLV